MISKRLVLLASVVAASASSVLSPQTNAAQPARVTQAKVFAKPVLGKPRPLHPSAKHVAAAAVRYTVVDDGVPSSPNVYLQFAVAFNNAGQIAGAAFGGLSNLCEFFDGSTYHNLSAEASITNCTVNGMNDLNASTGTTDVVGFALTATSGPYSSDSKAFIATFAAAGATSKVFTEDQSALVAINDSGEALGTSVYVPLGGFVNNHPPFALSSTATDLSLLQPGCTSIKQGCAGLLPQQSVYRLLNACGFGGCEIIADGTSLLSDLFNGSYELVAADGTTRDVVLDPLVLAAPIMNNDEQLAYPIETVQDGVVRVSAQLYGVKTGSVVTAPRIRGNSCLQYIPLSLNNVGQILGYTTGCAKNDYTYFTFDPKNGTQDVAIEFSSTDYQLTPTAINDNGEILLSIQQLNNGSSLHWGLLEPVSAQAKAARVRRLIARRTRVAVSSALKVEAVAPEKVRAPFARQSRPSAALAARPKPRPIRLRRTAAATGTYRIVDYGAPATAAYTIGMPVAFNNTGQVIGIATDIPYGNNTVCVLYDGTRYRTIGPSSITQCSPFGMSDELSSTGNLNIVGEATTPYSYGDDKAFFAKITPKTGFAEMFVYAQDDGSVLTGVNASGLAVGEGNYTPAGYSDYPGAVIVLRPGSTAPAILEASATNYGCPSSGCGYTSSGTCPFGGCYVTTDGTLFLGNQLVAPNGTKQPVTFAGNSYAPIINNNLQLLYDGGHSTVIDQLPAGKLTIVPPIPGSACPSSMLYPLSFNNAGHVLGVAYYCSPITEQDVFFIYDAVHGTRDLSALLPSGNATVLPLGINDKDQILVELTLSNGAIHWGILQPPAASAHKQIRRLR